MRRVLVDDNNAVRHLDENICVRCDTDYAVIHMLARCIHRAAALRAGRYRASRRRITQYVIRTVVCGYRPETGLPAALLSADTGYRAGYCARCRGNSPSRYRVRYSRARWSTADTSCITRMHTARSIPA